MKQLSIITAILLLAFNLSAQSNRSGSERETRRSSSSERVERKKSDNNQRAVRSSSSSDRNRSSVSRSANRSSGSGDYKRRSSSGSSSRPSARTQDPQRRESSIRPSNSQRNMIERSSRSTREVHRNDDRPRPSTYKRSESTRSANRSANRESTVDRSRNADRNRSEARTTTRTRTTITRERDYRPRTGRVYTERRQSYSYHRPNRVVRRAPAKVYHSYRPIEYRRVHYVYRTPPRVRLVWDIHMYNEYRYLYPNYDLWYYPIGYRIHTISAYDAGAYIGEVARVYGEVFDAWYSRSTDEYYLYIGAPFPYQDLSIVVEGRDARRFSRHPLRYFTGRHVAATGLIGIYEGKPEMFLKKRSQLDVY